MARKRPSEGSRRRLQLSTEEEEATGVSEVRSIPSTVGRQSPRSQQRPPARTAKRRGRRQKPVVFGTIHRSGRGWREPPLPPVLPRGAQDSVGCPRGESRVSEPGTHEVRVHESSHRWQKSVGRIARLVRREVARPRGEPGR
jgi:hypothetical protein